MSDSLWPPGLQHARPPCPSPTPRVYSNSCPLNWWSHPTISSSVIPFSSRLQSFSASGLFKWVSSSYQEVKALAFQLQHQSFQGIFRTDGMDFGMDWLDLLKSKGLFKNLLQCHSSKASIFWHSALFIVQLSHPYMTAGKTIALTRGTFVGKEMSLLFNMPSRLIITFLPRSKHLLILWLQSPSAVILELPKINSVTASIVSPSFAMKWWDQMPWSSFFECLVLSQVFHFPLSPSSGGSLLPLHFLPLKWYHLHIWSHWYSA